MRDGESTLAVHASGAEPGDDGGAPPDAARACPVCEGASSARKYLSADRHYGIEGEWWIRQCRGCDSLFLEAPPSQDELASLYSPSYYAYHVVPASATKSALRRLLGYSTDTRDPHFAEPMKVLDFGCGAGEFLLRMRTQGWECAGVENNARARETARRSGLDVRPAILGPNGFEPGTFDYVRANHSLEHVLAPSEAVRDMCIALRPGGILFVGVPTTSSENARLFGSSWWHLTAPLHTFVPSTRGMHQMLERAGFRVTRSTTNGDYAGIAGSLQIALNRGTSRRSNQGLIFAIRPLLLLGHWLAKLQDLRGVGDKLELIAVRPEREQSARTS